MTDQEQYDQLAYYTLAHPDPGFIHQLAVDTYAAQHADTSSKPIYLAFALAGLFLHNERGSSGKEVQQAHMRLARNKPGIPRFELPAFRGDMTVSDIVAAEPGPERDAAIERWSSSTWQAFQPVHAQVEEWLQLEQEI